MYVSNSNYKEFLASQCANCSLFLTNENTKLTNVKENVNCTNNANSNKQIEISNTKAISYVYGLSNQFLSEKLKSCFTEHNNYGCEPKHNGSNDFDVSECFEGNQLVLCEKCGSVFEDLYGVSKLFRNLSDKTSLIWKILEERGFEASIEEDESNFDIKEEEDSVAVSNEEDLLDHWKECETRGGNSDIGFADIKPDADEISNKEESEDADAYGGNINREKIKVKRKQGLSSCHVEPSCSDKIQLRKRKQDLKQTKIRNPDDKLSDGDTCGEKQKEIEEDEQEMDVESLNGNFSDDNFSPRVSEASDQSDDEYLSSNSRIGKRLKSKSKTKKINNQVKNYYEKIVWKEESAPENATKFKYKCKECCNIFISLPVINRHFLSQHFKGTSVHSERIDGPPYGCPKCEFQVKKLDALHNHCARKHDLKLVSKKKLRKPGDFLKCVECETSYENSVGFVMHQKHKHGRRYYMCSLCRDVFPLESELESHKSQCTAETRKARKKNEEEGISPDDKKDGDTIQIQYCEELYFCRECNCKFETRPSLIGHQYRSHNGVQKYDCSCCDSTFFYLSSFLNHMSDVHKEYARAQEYLDLYVCEEAECKNVLYTYNSYKSYHKLVKHKSFKIICAFCEESFTDAKTLKVHKMKSHKERNSKQESETFSKGNSAGKLYNCWYCYQTFENKKDEQKHRASHPEEERIFRCTECNLTFNGFSSWYNHKAGHRDANKSYLCPTCGRKLNGLRQYRQHCKRHAEIDSGKRPACEICGKTFTTGKQLLKHRTVIHLRKQEKTCHLCGHVSKTGYNMRTHLKVHEKNGILRKRKNRNP